MNKGNTSRDLSNSIAALRLAILSKPENNTQDKVEYIQEWHQRDFDKGVRSERLASLPTPDVQDFSFWLGEENEDE